MATVAELRHGPYVGHARRAGAGGQGSRGHSSITRHARNEEITERTRCSMTTTACTMPMNTPVGRLVLESAGDVLIGIWLPNKTKLAGSSDHDGPPVLKDAATQPEEYFARVRTEFD